MDPDVAEIVQQLSGVTPTDIISIVGPQTGGFGLVIYFAWKRAQARIQAAEEKIDRLLEVFEVLEKLVGRDAAQHRFNGEVWEAILLIVRRVGEIKCNPSDPQADLLSLGHHPSGEPDGG